MTASSTTCDRVVGHVWHVLSKPHDQEWSSAGVVFQECHNESDAALIAICEHLKGRRDVMYYDATDIMRCAVLPEEFETDLEDEDERARRARILRYSLPVLGVAPH